MCPRAMIQPDIDSGALVRLSDQMTPDVYNQYMLSAVSANRQTTWHTKAFQIWAIADCDAAK